MSAASSGEARRSRSRFLWLGDPAHGRLPRRLTRVGTIFLIRHGLTAQTGKVLYGQTEGIPLDRRGRAQAEDLARRFASVRLTAIYSSPLERCVETVEPLAAAQRLSVVVRKELIEMHAGSWTGRSLAQLRRTKLWRTVQGGPSEFRFPDGGEGFLEAQARVVAEIERIAKRHRRGRVAIATHGDIARMAVAAFAGAPLDEFQRIVIDTASVSVITLDGGTARVILVNDTGGLQRFGANPAPPWEWDGSGPKVRG
jgi:probable phosphomutase (TIGR03848 family)